MSREFNSVVFVQGFESVALNDGMMYENIVSGIAPDKTIAFFVICVASLDFDVLGGCPQIIVEYTRAFNKNQLLETFIKIKGHRPHGILGRPQRTGHFVKEAYRGFEAGSPKRSHFPAVGT